VKHSLLTIAFGVLGIADAQEIPKAIEVEGDPPQVEVVPGVELPSLGPARSVSVSNQFIVIGVDASLRSTNALLGDEVKKSLLAMSEEKDEWKTPITIRILGKQGEPIPNNPVRFHLTFNERGWDLALDVHVGVALQRERMRRVITEALLYEQALREMPPAENEVPLVAPPWLVEGLLEAVAWKEQQTDRKLYAALFNHGGIYRLPDLLAVDESSYKDLDGGTRAAFRVASGALVMALVEQPQGKEGFQRFLRQAASFGGEMPILLKQCFPELNLSERSLEKWVALKVAEAKEPALTESLGVEETERGLQEALILHFRNAGELFIEQPIELAWQDVAALSSGKRTEAVRSAEDALVRLSYRSFPSYRPLISEYQLILRDIAAGKTATVAGRLAKLSETRATMLARTRDAADFLDWFEITRAREISGEFEDYLKLKERLKDETPKRNDPISAYLDLMQKAMGSPARSSARPR
jgi:hypothetical protein